MIEKYLRTICYPESTNYKSELERELAYQRSKCLTFIQIIFVVTLLSYRPFSLERARPSIDMWIAFGMTALILHLLTAKKFHREFEYFYNGSVMILSPYSVYLLKESIFGSWMIYYLCPVYIFFLTGSVKHFTAQALVQIFSSLYVFKVPTLEVINEYGSEAFLNRLVRSFVIGQILMIATIVQLDISRKVAYDRANLLEARKEEAERQRTFLLSFSHELRNMMNSVMGSIDICLMEDLTEKMTDILQSAKLCSKILLQEINNILDSGKVEINELEIHKVPQMTKSLLNKIWMVSGELIKRKNLNGMFAVSRLIPDYINIDEGRLTQILLNLLGNAVKFTDKGMIDMVLEWHTEASIKDAELSPSPYSEDGLFEKKMALLHLNDEFDCLYIGNKLPKASLKRDPDTKGYLKFFLRDSGCGMTEEEIRKLFQKFSQVGDTRKKNMGTGLGLFISKYICKKMGGTIEVYSKKNSGTVFSVTIPVEVASQEIANGKADALPNQSTTVQISNFHSDTKKNFGCMIVDDEEFNIVVLKNYIKAANGDLVETAKNGEIAVQRYKDLCFQGKAPALITMDISMPVMDGKEASKRIRDFEEKNRLKPCLIIIISANCTQSEFKDCMETHGQIRADAFLKKPVNIEEFKEIVASLLRRYVHT